MPATKPKARNACPTCGVVMNNGNMTRHARACAAKAVSGLFAHLTVRKRNNWKRLLINEYGISLEDFQRIFSQQGGVCAICGDHAPLAIDHNHRTNKVRGLLCGHCNRLLGCADDRIEILKAAILYLERFGEIEPDGCDTPEYRLNTMRFDTTPRLTWYDGSSLRSARGEVG